MDRRDFIIWMEGFLEGKEQLSEKDTEILRKKIEGVTPDIFNEPVIIPAPFPTTDDWIIKYDDNKDQCSVCGLKFTDSLGRPLVMGYVCNNLNCPTGLGPTICSVSTNNTTYSVN